jgi:CBS domain-containing protein
LTAVVFALELTHDVNALMPVLLAVTIAHGFTVLTLRRSILTEKVSRRGFHLSREYSIDPLEIIFAREVARPGVVAFSSDTTRAQVASALSSLRSTERPRPVSGRGQHDQRLFPIVDASRRLAGVVTRSSLREWLDETECDPRGPIDGIIQADPVIAYADEPLRVVAFRMAEKGVTRLPVVSRRDRSFVGMIALSDLLIARAKILDAEQRRERVLGSGLRLPVFGRRRTAA